MEEGRRTGGRKRERNFAPHVARRASRVALSAMIISSIRWRLQLWYGLLLVIVLAGFGFTAYQVERSSLFPRVDDELRQRVNQVAVALNPGGPEIGRAHV